MGVKELARTDVQRPGRGSKKKPIRRLRLFAAVAAVALVALACGDGGNGEGEAEARSGELEQSKITVAWAPLAANDVTNRLPDFAKKYGLDVNLIEAGSGPDTLTALVSGSAHVAVLTWTYVFQAQDANLDIVALASQSTKGTAILFNKRLGIDSGDYAALKTLAEERAAAGNKLRLVTGLASINHALGFLALQQNGIDVDKLFDVRDVPEFPLHPQMLEQNAADVVITGEPGAGQAVVNDSAVATYPYDTPAGALNTEYLATREFVKENPNTAAAFVQAVRDSIDHLEANPTEEVTDVVNYMGLNEAVAEKALENVDHSVDLDLNGAKELAKILFDFKIVENDYSSRIEDLVEQPE